MNGRLRLDLASWLGLPFDLRSDPPVLLPLPRLDLLSPLSPSDLGIPQRTGTLPPLEFPFTPTPVSRWRHILTYPWQGGRPSWQPQGDLFQIRPPLWRMLNLEGLPPEECLGIFQNASVPPDLTTELIFDLLRHISSADVTIDGIPTNSANRYGECRYEEFRSLQEPEGGPQNVCFQPDTTTTFRLEIRPVEGRGESVIHHLSFQYSQPIRIRRLGVVPILHVRGFYDTNPRSPGRDLFAPVCEGGSEGFQCDSLIPSTPFGIHVPPPDPNHFILRYATARPARPATLPPVFQVTLDGPRPEVSLPVLERIIEPYADATGELIITGFLSALGLGGNVSDLYAQVGVPVHTFPRSVQGFLTLFHPLFFDETSRDLDRHVPTWNPNTQSTAPGHPELEHPNRLFNFREAERFSASILFRAGNLAIPHGHLRIWDSPAFTRSLEEDRRRIEDMRERGQTEAAEALSRDVGFRRRWLQSHPTQMLMNRLQARGSPTEIRATLIGPAFESIRYSAPNPGCDEDSQFSIQIDHLLADRLTAVLPPLQNFLDGTEMDSVPLRFRLDEPYLSALRLQLGTITFRAERVRANSIEIQLPSLAEMRRLHFNRDEILSRAQMTISGLAADEIHIENPTYDLEITLYNPRLNTVRLNPPVDGGSPEGIRMEIDSGDLEGLSLLASGAGPIRVGPSHVEGVRLHQRSHHSTGGFQLLRSAGSIHYEDGLERGTRLQLSGGAEIRDLEFQFDFEPGEDRRLRIDFGLSSSLGEGALRTHMIDGIQIREGRIEGGRFHGEARWPRGNFRSSTYLAELQGNISLAIDRIDHLSSDFNFPGFELDGNLQNIRLSGDAMITVGNDRWRLARAEGSLSPLRFSAEIVQTQIRHDPSEADEELRRTPGHEAAQTDTTLHHATLQIEDLARLGYRTPPTDTDGSSPNGGLELDLRGLRMMEIQNGGEIWAPLPPWRYLRALLSLGGDFIPVQRGRPLRPLPLGGDCSQLPGGRPEGITSPENFIYLGAWLTQPGTEGRLQTTLRDLRTCLHSEPVDQRGSRPFVVIGIPELSIHPGERPLVRSSDAPIHMDSCLLDLRRGGWICLNPPSRRR